VAEKDPSGEEREVGGRRSEVGKRKAGAKGMNPLISADFAGRVGLKRTQLAAHVSPAPSIHSVRRVFPNTVGSAVFYRASFRFSPFDARSSVSQALAYVQALISPCGAITLQPSPVRPDDRTHRPLAQRGLSCPHLLALLRPDAPVSETLPGLALGLCPSVFAQMGCLSHLPFFALSHCLDMPLPLPRR
jgi:hypothetical protein